MILKTCKFCVAIAIAAVLLISGITQTGCGVYRFKDVSIPDSIEVVRVNMFQNKATYINPQLAPKLTESVTRKIMSQTKLKQTIGDDAHWDINATVSNYSMSTAGISNQRVNANRLNVGVKIEVKDNRSQKTSKYDVSRSFDYDGSLSLQQAEQQLETELLRSLSDDIFNRIFSNW